MGVLSEADIIEIGILVYNALAATQVKGIIHRDIKSDNIIQ